MSLADVINAKLKVWATTDAGKKAMGQAVKSGANSGTTHDAMIKYAEHMKDILRKEIAEIKRDLKYGAAEEAYLDCVDIDKSVSVVVSDGKECLSVGVSFDHKLLHRDSLYSSSEDYKDGVDLAYLVNNGYSARNYVYGTDTHGNDIRSAKSQEANNYIQRAVDLFNAEMSSKGVVAEYSANYTGGTFGTKEY